MLRLSTCGNTVRVSHPRAVAGLMAALCVAVPPLCASSAYAADDAARKTSGESGDNASGTAGKTAAESTGKKSEAAAGAAGSAAQSLVAAG